MMVHAPFGGHVFSNGFVVPVVGAAVLVWGLVRKRWPRSVPWLMVVLFAIVVLAIFETPVLHEGTGVRAGDSSLHMGWTEQLLRGESVPPGPAPEFARNAYPWGFHTVMATMVRLVPETDTFAAQEALHLLLLFALPLGCACLARRLYGGSGWAGALCGAVVAGWGWISARGIDFVASPLNARHGADMVAASPNSVYELFPPAFPRELGLVVLSATALLIVLAIRTEDRRFGVLAGISAGLVGLISAPLFLTAALWTVVGGLLAGPGARRRMFVTLAGPTLLVFALWVGPVAYNYIRYGGFVNITSRLGVEWPMVIALASWGLLFPLAVAGIVMAFRSSTTGARVLLGFALVAVAMLLLARARAAFDWQLAGNATALHQGRVWPVAHLLGAAFAGAALAAGFNWLRRRSEFSAPVAVAAVAVIGSLSLWLSSQGLTRVIHNDDNGFIYNRPEFADGSFIVNAAEVLGPDDIVEAPPGPDNVLGFWLFQFSGVRVTGHDDPRYKGNELRIRYEELAGSYAEVMAAGGFDADYVPLPEADAAEAGIGSDEVMAEGRFNGRRWVLVEAGALDHP
ncbi:MAG: hypothetical protein ACRDJ2_05265 [Actinomycetota bacterium]